MPAPFDPRITPARPDLAAAHLEGDVEAARFVEGVLHQCVLAATPLRRTPAPDAMQETQILFGETFTIYDEANGWSWGQATLDDYVGYAESSAFSADVIAPTHRVSALRTIVFSKPDLKSAPLLTLSLNARVTKTADAERFVQIARGGYVFAKHLAPLGESSRDWVAEAERFLGAPYVWGGRDSIGLDCSGLIQAALIAAGKPSPRDTDMMERALGAPVTTAPDLSGLLRGDLVFWRGHMGVMVDETRLLHANAHHMATVIEPLAEVNARSTAGPITSVRRL